MRLPSKLHATGCGNITMENCPCGSGKTTYECCGACIEGRHIPATPEELMRSRYTAYTQANIDYIANTMKSPALDHFNAESARTWAERAVWIKLDVVFAQIDGDKGSVEFFAHFSQNGKRHVIHELSEFHLENGRWYYMNGIDPRQPPIGATRVKRNATCPCGSNKKYKKCCGGVLQ